MALTLVISAGAGNPSAIAGQKSNYVLTVTNTGAAAVSLQALSLNEVSKMGVSIGQPNFLASGQPAGSSSFPVLGAGLSASYPFQVVYPGPYGAGPSPQAAGGASPGSAANPAGSPFARIQAQSQSSDGSVNVSETMLVPVLSTIEPFPLAQGGAFQFGQGFNFINGLTLFAL